MLKAQRFRNGPKSIVQCVIKFPRIDRQRATWSLDAHFRVII